LRVGPCANARETGFFYADRGKFFFFLTRTGTINIHVTLQREISFGPRIIWLYGHSLVMWAINLNSALPRYTLSPGLRGVANREICLLLPRAYSTEGNGQNTVLHIPKANVYRFGDSNNARPVFQDLQWTVKDGESWAVVGSGSGEKTALFQVGENGYIYIHLPSWKKKKKKLEHIILILFFFLDASWAPSHIPSPTPTGWHVPIPLPAFCRSAQGST